MSYKLGGGVVGPEANGQFLANENFQICINILTFKAQIKIPLALKFGGRAAPFMPMPILAV